MRRFSGSGASYGYNAVRTNRVFLTACARGQGCDGRLSDSHISVAESDSETLGRRLAEGCWREAQGWQGTFSISLRTRAYAYTHEVNHAWGGPAEYLIAPRIPPKLI